MIGWNKAKSPKQPHVPLKQLENQFTRLSGILEKRAPQDDKLKGNQKAKDNWWREHDKVPFSVLERRAKRLGGIIAERKKGSKAWNGKAW